MLWQPGLESAEAGTERKLAAAAFMALGALPVALIVSRSAADGLGSAVGILFLIRSFMTRDWAWLRQPLARIGLGFWLYTLLAVSPMALNPGDSLMRAASWVRYLLFVFAMAYWLGGYTAWLRRLYAWLAVVLAFVMVDSLVQYAHGVSLTGHEKPGGRLSGPFAKMVTGIFLAKLALIPAGAWAYDFLRRGSLRSGALAATLLTAAGVLILISNERTALLTFAVGLIICWMALLRFRRTRLPAIGMAAALVAAFAVILTTQPQVASRAQDSRAMLGNFAASPYGQLWIASWDIWRQYPLLGAGMMNFRLACPVLQEAGKVTYCDLHSHNPYFEMLSETGAIGLVGFIALLAAIVARVMRRRDREPAEALALKAFALAALMPNFFPLAATQDIFSNWPGWLAWFSVGLAVSLGGVHDET